MRIGKLNDIANIKYIVRRAEGSAPVTAKIDGNPFLGDELYVKWEELYEDSLDIAVELGGEYYLGDLCLNLHDGDKPYKITVFDDKKSRIIVSYSAETGKNISENNITLEIYEKLRSFIIQFDVYFAPVYIDSIVLYGADTSEMLLFPTPKSITAEKDSLPLRYLASVSVGHENAKPAFEIFAEKLSEKVGIEPAVSLNGTLRFIFDENIIDNGYRLTVGEKTAELYAKDVRGFVYGAESLIKLVTKNGVPTVNVDDEPRMPFRGVHLLLPGSADMEFAKRFIKYVVSPMGYNAVIIELAGGMRFDSHPEILDAVLNAKDHEKKGEWPHFPHGEPGGEFGVSKAEVADFVDYIRSFGIEPIPEIQSLGHVQFMTVAHPEIAEVAENSLVKVDELTADVPPNKFYAHCYCPSNEKSYEILFDLIDEIIEVFRPTEYVHMGHDEVYEIGVCPVCKDKDPAELLAYDINKIYDYLKSKGYKMMIWADMLQPVTKYLTPRAIDMIPKDILLLDFIWYFHMTKDIEDNLLDKDFKVVYGNVYSSHFPRYEDRILKDGIVGAQTSAWVSTSEKEMGKEGKIYEFMLSGEAFWNTGYNTHLRYVYDQKIKQLMPTIRNSLRKDAPLTGKETLIYDIPAEFPLARDTELVHSVDVGRTADALIFRHVSTKKLTRRPWGPLDEIGHYKVTYTDGEFEIIPVEYGGNISHFARRQNEPFKGKYYRHNGYSATYFVDGIEGKTDEGNPFTVYRLEWRNPNPEKEIASVTVVDNGKFNTKILLMRLSSI